MLTQQVTTFIWYLLPCMTPLAIAILLLVFGEPRIERRGKLLVVEKDRRKQVAISISIYQTLVGLIAWLPAGFPWWWMEIAFLLPTALFWNTPLLFRLTADRTKRTVLFERQRNVKPERSSLQLGSRILIAAEEIRTGDDDEELPEYAVYISNNSMLTNVMVTSFSQATRIADALNEYFSHEGTSPTEATLPHSR